MIKYIKLGGMTMTPKQKAWAIQAEHVIKQSYFFYCSGTAAGITDPFSMMESAFDKASSFVEQ